MTAPKCNSRPPKEEERQQEKFRVSLCYIVKLYLRKEKKILIYLYFLKVVFLKFYLYVLLLFPMLWAKEEKNRLPTAEESL